MTFIKQKVKSEDDYSYIEKLARPRKPFKDYDHFLPNEDNECVFAPDISYTQKKVRVAGKFSERYKGYVVKYEHARKQTKDEPDCTFAPTISLGQYREAVLERGPLVDRMTRDAKLRQEKQASLVKEADANAGTFKPCMEASHKRSAKIIEENRDLTKPFLKRVQKDINLREEKQIIRKVRAENPPELTFKPRIVSIGSEDIPAKRGSFMERMAADTRNRELKLLYRAKLFGLPLPMQKRLSGEDAVPASARPRSATRKGTGKGKRQTGKPKPRSKTRK